jgi:hypothetical protein
MRQALSQFRKEIRHFFLVSLFNLFFAAIATAFGVAYIVTAVSREGLDPTATGHRMLIGAVAMICFGLGIRWLLSTVTVFEGIEEISDELDSTGYTITDDQITCLIVQMLARYRDNRKTIRTMIRVCTLGGCCFFVLGLVNSLKALAV